MNAFGGNSQNLLRNSQFACAASFSNNFTEKVVIALMATNTLGMTILSQILSKNFIKSLVTCEGTLIRCSSSFFEITSLFWIESMLASFSQL